MNRDDLLRDLADALSDLKRDECAAARGPAAVVPAVHVFDDDGPVMSNPVPSRAGILAAVTTWRAVVDEPARWVAYTTESWVGTDPDPGARAAEGDPTVSEALYVAAVDVGTGDAGGLLVPYAYDDDGLPSFGDARPLRPDGGAVLDLLREAAEGLR